MFHAAGLTPQAGRGRQHVHETAEPGGDSQHRDTSSWPTKTTISSNSLSTHYKRKTHILHALPQVLLVGRVLDDRNHERVQVAQRRPRPLDPHPLDHLLVTDPELVPFPQQRRHHGVLRVRVDARARVAELVRVEEERRARTLLQGLVGRPAEEGPGGERDDKDVAGLNALFLDARWRDEDLLAVEWCGGLAQGWRREEEGGSLPITDGDTSAGAGDPAELVEGATEGGNQVGGVELVRRLDERVVVGDAVGRDNCDHFYAGEGPNRGQLPSLHLWP